MSFNNVVYKKLLALGYSGTLPTMLLEYYQDNGAVSKILPKAEQEFLEDKTGEKGAIPSLWKIFLEDEGYSGALPSMKYKFWDDLVVPED